MKRKVAFLLVFVLLFTMLCGCDNTTSDFNSNDSINSNENYRDHQELVSNVVSFDANKMMRFSIPEVGLENVYVEYVSNSERICAEGYGRVYLLADYRYGGALSPADLYLLVEFDDKIFVKDLSKWDDNACYFYDINLCDVNGDADVEIVLNVCVSMTGGSGNHLSRVFDFKDNAIAEIFCSENENGEDFDTGYSITILKDRKFKIENKFTVYSEEFLDCRSDRDDKYSIYWWYDPETGEPKDISLWVDSFYEFKPIDVDQDGVYEIMCRQYVCLVDHADGLGDAKTILKYNKDTLQFEVIDTKFECYD